MAAKQHITLNDLHRHVSHLSEIASYLHASLSHLEVKLAGFSDNGDLQVPDAICESVCKQIAHDSSVSAFLYESLESLYSTTCRREVEDLTGHDVAEQPDRNGGAA